MLSADDLGFITGTLGRALTDVESACFENLWSEHCSYRSTKSVLKTLPTEGEDVILGPGDDAAVVRFSDDLAVVVGMESHNHPSYVDPYDGAATGVGGIVRDIISMGARPIALMDPLYFGSLDGEKTRYLFEHIVGGIGGYGNCIGVPVVRGETVFDPSYQGNPLVNVVCVGVVDPDHYLTARVKAPGNRLVLYGSSTGRDGLGGASFASRDLSEDSEASERTSVQIGDPYTEKLLIEATCEMAATGKVLACRDLGAAGLAGASSEMASSFGAKIVADRVHLREEGMNAVEIMLAESQERMLVEAAPEDVALIGAIAEKYDLRWSEIGEVIAEPRYIVEFEGTVVCDLPVDLLVGGTPGCALPKTPKAPDTTYTPPEGALKTLALAVLSHPDVASKEWIVEQYDHHVQLRTVSTDHDAGVLRLGDAALVLSCGCNPRQIALAPYENAANAVYENAANLACLGARPLCIVNCLNFASPSHPEVFWEMEQSVLGLGDMARALDAPVVGGNVSMYNESDEFGTEIKPTPTIGMVGKGPVRRWTAPAAGDRLALVGATGAHLGGSVLDAVTGCGGAAPPKADPAVMEKVRDLVAADALTGATDLSKGGLIAALAKLAPDAEVAITGDDPLVALFSETYGRFLVAFKDEAALEGLEYQVIGTVGGEGLRLTVGDEAFSLSREEIEEARTSITRLMRF
ncbi:phosphoribosylformylglycinamidine synthase [Methanofollis sp. W23]|uniref:phosphoribosylformylglycinamidine synthase subunit PurL n=1 Tax=Methanofollis sp. W23 TaxID=2817849 RepID=UPI001AE8A9AD|nr:phosphoribosylformylglycinamidine synthase subunit PurL [Methanofollis sp. W23]MBP2146731.1 phosphoribosylformylglycinamidine synthase [Methanofollis sp. W23]